MLIEFRIRNYRSFRNEQVFSLTASKDETYLNHVIHVPRNPKLKLLRTAVLYGPNASGKTSLLDGMNFARRFVRSSAKYEPEDPIAVEPFLLDGKSSKLPTMFEFTFIENGVRYQYGFEATKERVTDEWLISYPQGRPRKLFTRADKGKGGIEYSFSSSLKGEKGKITELTRPNALFLSVGATFNNPQLLIVYRWFSEKLIPVKAGRMRDVIFEDRTEDDMNASRVRELLKYADLGIVDFHYTEKDVNLSEVPKDAPPEMRKVFEALKSVLDSLPEQPKQYEVLMSHEAGKRRVTLPFHVESDGTKQLFFLSEPILDAVRRGKVLLVDELESSLHPLLVKALIGLFHDRETNRKNAQLVFNTHDTTLLNMALFRRDQVWFVEKDRKGVSHIYSLLEYSPRKDEAVGKGYLLGRYGAIPFIGELPRDVIAVG